jgi:hypothetical protein
MSIQRSQVLRLYKDLLRYSRQLVYSDPHYVARRVKQQFEANRSLQDAKDIEFFYQVSLICSLIAITFHYNYSAFLTLSFQKQKGRALLEKDRLL